MDEVLLEQSRVLIEKAKRILIIAHDPLDDHASSMLGLKLFLRKTEKDPKLVLAQSIDRKLSFLPGTKRIKKKILEKAAVISIDTSKKKASSLSYHREKNNLDIIVTSKEEPFSEEDITIKTNSTKYDLIIVLGCQSIEDLGSLYEESPEVFFNTPVINIDNQVGNDYFGEVNLVDIKVSSLSEITFELINYFNKNLIDKKIATCILCGIIAQTKCFQIPNTSPKTFSIASTLIEREADREAIIQNLYAKKKLSLLKLWGRALARIKKDNEFVWTILSKEDFEKSGAEKEELEEVLEELGDQLSDFSILLILAELEIKKITGLIKAGKGINLEKLIKSFSGSIYKRYGIFSIESKNLLDTEKEVVAKIKELQE